MKLITDQFLFSRFSFSILIYHSIYIFLLYLLLFVTISAQSAQEIQRLRQNYNQNQENQSQIAVPPRTQNIAPGTLDPQRVTLTPFSPIENRADSVDEHFGYNFFTRRDSVRFWENLPTPAGYLLGAGDELVISIWGETQLRKKYPISREGTIYDEKIGLLNITGKTIELAQEYLQNQFGRVYATLQGNNPTSYIDVSLGQLRLINVNFVGEISYPGVYPIHPFSTLITGLIQAGGIDTTGSLRNIQIKREGTLITEVDLYDYLLKGEIPQNIQLRDQDIVIVPVRMSTIKVDSAVHRPGIYEAKPGETVKEMIHYAGGLKFNSSKTIGLKRFEPLEKRSLNHSSIQNYYIKYENSQLTSLQDGDIITVLELFENLNYIDIFGQVKKPGRYYFQSGMKIKDLLYLGGGFEDSTFLKTIFMEKGELLRRNKDKSYETIIEIDFNDVMLKSEKYNLELQNLDRLSVHANPNYFEKETIQISGEVKVPGSYSLISDHETLQSILKRAGGITDKALSNGISIFRDTLYFEKPPEQIDRQFVELSDNNDESTTYLNEKISKNNLRKKVRVAWKDINIVMMPGDSIVVKEKTGTVLIAGEVYNPGLIEYRKGKSIRYYISSAGGITNYGSKNNVVIIYANGFSVKKQWLLNPNISDGATIMVYQKQNIKPFNLTEFVNNLTSIISTVVTTYILTQQIKN